MSFKRVVEKGETLFDAYFKKKEEKEAVYLRKNKKKIKPDKLEQDLDEDNIIRS